MGGDLNKKVLKVEIEDPERAAIAVKDYWKTTEWVSMEALKSTIGGNIVINQEDEESSLKIASLSGSGGESAPLMLTMSK